MFGIPMSLLAPTLAGSLLTGLLCGAMGVFVVRLRLSSLGFAMSHAAFAGAALGLLVSFLDPLTMAIAAAVLAAAVLGPLTEASRFNPDTVLGGVFPLFMALGLIFVHLAPSGAVGSGALSLLWGSVLGITSSDVLRLAAVTGGVLVVLFAFGKEMLVLLLDRRLAAASGINARAMTYLILFLTAITVAVTLKVAGGLLVYTMLILPASAAFSLLHDIKKVLLVAPLLGAVSSLAGMLLSLAADLPIGASITLSAAGISLITLALSPKRRRG